MTIYGFEAVFVTHNHVEAVTAALILGEANSATECCVNGVADRGAKVNTLVYAFEACAVAVRRCNHVLLDRHHIVANIDALAVRNICFLIRVYQTAFPAFGVDVGLWFNVFPKRFGIFLIFFEVDSLVDF